MKMLHKLLAACLFVMPLFTFPVLAVDINSADSEALVDELVGIGPQKAMAIVRYRQENGPFESVEDLSLVKGIGARTVEQNRARITVDTPETSPRP
jgi:competence protein ComEA